MLCLVPYPTIGASNRLRVEQYAPYLRSRGIELALSPFLDDAGYAVLYRDGATAGKVAAMVRGALRRLLAVVDARRYGLVLVHRESAPLGPPVVERALRALGVPYVFDMDDALFLGPIHPANRAWARLRHPSRVASTARAAARVIVGNEYLAAWARQHNQRVTVIPTPVDTDRHRPRPPHGGGTPVIGWVGSSTTAPYLRLLDEPLRRLRERRPFAIRVIGGEYAHPSVPVEARPYRLEAEPAEIASFDIGVLPEPDDPWTKGKGALKAILYLATAVPVVASRVGVNPEVIPDGRVGYCVDGDDEWVDALDRLAGDPDLRARLGAAGRTWVEERYSVRAQAPRLAEVLEEAATR